MQFNKPFTKKVINSKMLGNLIFTNNPLKSHFLGMIFDNMQHLKLLPNRMKLKKFKI